MSGRRTKGEGSMFQRADGMWVGRVDLGWVGGKRRRPQVTAKTKRELTPKFRKLQREVEAGVLSDSMTVEAWLRHWLEKVAPARCRQRTLDGYRTYVEQYLIPHLGKHRLDRLTPDHVRRLHATMAEDGLADSTRRQAHAILRRALVVAERDGKVGRNVAALVDPPPVGTVHHEPLSLQDARKVLKVLDGDPMAARWVCALLLGLRQGEALGLRWEDIDFDAQRIHVRHELIRLRGKGLVLTDPKSKTSRRSIPFGEVAPAAFALTQVEHRGEYVFYGEPMDPKKDWSAWKALLVKAGVSSADEERGDMPALHAARGTTASLLDMAGVSDKVIAEILGHSSVQITRTAYIHGNEDRHRQGLGAMSALLAGDQDRAAG
jgi:integrase